VEPFPTHCNQWDEGIVAVEPHGTKPGFAVIRYTDWDDFEVKTKVVKARRTLDP
jgi:hypothetical protein